MLNLRIFGVYLHFSILSKAVALITGKIPPYTYKLIHYIYIYTYIYTHTHKVCYCIQYIQGVSRLEDITAGGDLLGLCDQKSSYKHVCDFGRFRSYEHF